MAGKYAIGPAEAKQMDTAALRDNFLFGNLISDDQCNLEYTQYDRMIVGGVKPVSKQVELTLIDNLKAEFFLQRREIGIINVGGKGKIKAGDDEYSLSKLDCLYAGKGVKNIAFSSDDAGNPAVFFLLSCPAHQSYPTRVMTKEEATPAHLGSLETSNERTIYKYIHNDGLESCQLVMGLTVLNTGSVWNTMPPHTHDRRMEVYVYFDVKDGHAVFHMMGQPQESRHMLVSNYQAIMSPPWSIHAGCGTSNYSFIWAMAGENKEFTDMDQVAVSELR